MHAASPRSIRSEPSQAAGVLSSRPSFMIISNASSSPLDVGEGVAVDEQPIPEVGRLHLPQLVGPL